MSPSGVPEPPGVGARSNYKAVTAPHPCVSTGLSIHAAFEHITTDDGGNGQMWQ
jgi:hypothetical protein